MPLAETHAKKIVERVLSRVTRTPGAAALVRLAHEQAGNTRFAVNEITSSSEVITAALSVTVAFGPRAAGATTNQLDDASIDDVVARATRMARLAPEDPERMPLLGRQSYPSVRGASDQATERFAAAGRARAASAAIARATAAKLAIAGFYEHVVASTSIATSAGLWGHHRFTRCQYTCSARTPDGTGAGWAGAASSRVADLDVEALAAVAIDKATRSAKPRRLEPGHYTVVLEPSAVCSLLGNLAYDLSQRDADEGRSFFARAGGGTKVGETLFPATITVASDPGDAALAVAPFDDDGMPRPARRWIDRGKVAGLACSRYWAKQRSLTATGEPDGWSLAGGTATREQLIKGVKRGVLITRIWYLGAVDPQALLMTGLTRDGTFLIENGEVVAPVNNFRFNDSPVKMLARCDGLSAPIVVQPKEFSAMRAPALRTHDFHLSSVSEAV